MPVREDAVEQRNDAGIGLQGVLGTSLDVLDDFTTLKVAVGYELPDGTPVDTVPADPQVLAQIKPRYEEIRGWGQSTVGITDEAMLPTAARDYLGYLERRIGVPIVLVSTGPRREESIFRRDSQLAAILAPPK